MTETECFTSDKLEEKNKTPPKNKCLGWIIQLFLEDREK